MPPLENGASSDGSSHARDWDAEVDWNRALVGGRPQVFAVESENDRVVSSAEARRTLDDDLQDCAAYAKRRIWSFDLVALGILHACDKSIGTTRRVNYNTAL